MPLATKDNAIIIKEGKLANSCDCCGGWYCYGCVEGFKYDPLSGFDYAAFGTVSINGVSTFAPYQDYSEVAGCFAIQSERFYQKSTQPLCQAWVTGRNGNPSVSRYVRKQFYDVRQNFGNYINVYGVPVRVGDGSVFQSTLDLTVTIRSSQECNVGGRFVSTQVSVDIISNLRVESSYINSSSNIDFSDYVFKSVKAGSLTVRPGDADSWPIRFDGTTLAGVANAVVTDSVVNVYTGTYLVGMFDQEIIDFAISILPTSAPVVISPQLVHSACQ
jgi:hypothetical protein